MPRPTRGIGQTSDLRVRCARPEGRREVIKEFVQAFEEERDLDRAAIRFGARRRTLERLAAEYPELRRAINEARNRLAVL